MSFLCRFAFTLQASPLMPGACGRMLDQLGVAPEARTTKHLTMPGAEEKDLFATAVAPGTPLQKPVGLFPRIELEE